MTYEEAQEKYLGRRVIGHYTAFLEPLADEHIEGFVDFIGYTNSGRLFCRIDGHYWDMSYIKLAKEEVLPLPG